MRKSIPTLSVILVLASFALGSSALGQVFDVSYEADVLPSAATPSWTQPETAPGVQEINPTGVLHLQDTGTGTWQWRRQGESWGTQWTIEFRLQVHSTGKTSINPTGDNIGEGAAQLAIDDGTRRSSVWVLQNQVALIDNSDNFAAGQLIGTFPMDTTDGFHVYRYARNGPTATLFVDGTSVLSGTLTNAVSTQDIVFGASGFFGSSDSRWDYVRYNLNTFTPPGPPPPGQLIDDAQFTLQQILTQAPPKSIAGPVSAALQVLGTTETLLGSGKPCQAANTMQGALSVLEAAANRASGSLATQLQSAINDLNSARSQIVTANQC